jgi:hypothetical protein
MLALRLRLEEGWQNTRTTLALLSLTRPENPPSPRFRQSFSGTPTTVDQSDKSKGGATPRRVRQRRFFLRYIGRIQ